MGNIRVLVVEDSLTVRRRLVEVLNAAPGMEVVGEAEDGRQAIELCEQLRPDIVTLDLMLPVMSGLAATEYIMAYCPTPILIISSSDNRGELFKTYDVLAAGAVDVLEKARAESRPGEWEQKLVSTVRLVSRIRVIMHPRARLAEQMNAAVRSMPPARSSTPAPLSTAFQCVAIGASTGGPGAVLEILRNLDGFPLPILLVIHIGEPFGFAMSDWLDSISPLRVMTAVHGQPMPRAGDAKVIIAPHAQHLLLRDRRLWLSDAPERHSCRPSVDVLFESVAQQLGPAAIACLLTGMGRDGAQGLLEVRKAGGTTIAQDEATSVVWGMPREAVQLGAAQEVLALAALAPRLRELARRG
jgi:two-component system chemotaxis response regulator CheB